MCIKFESRKICVAGNECDSSDFDFDNAKHKELPVIKISSNEGREDCQQSKPKRPQASLGTIAVTILPCALCSRPTYRVYSPYIVYKQGLKCLRAGYNDSYSFNFVKQSDC